MNKRYRQIVLNTWQALSQGSPARDEVGDLMGQVWTGGLARTLIRALLHGAAMVAVIQLTIHLFVDYVTGFSCAEFHMGCVGSVLLWYLISLAFVAVGSAVSTRHSGARPFQHSALVCVVVVIGSALLLRSHNFSLPAIAAFILLVFFCSYFGYRRGLALRRKAARSPLA